MAVNRRQYARHSPTALVYVNLGANNEGMLLNLSEGGLAFQVVAPVERYATPRFLCVLGGKQRLEATGEITWTSETRKMGGLKFTDLPEPSRKLIADWLVNLPLCLAAEPAPEHPPEQLPAPVQAGSAEAEAGATAAAATPPAGPLDVPQGPEAHAPPERSDSALPAPALDWRPLTHYEWLQEPAKKRHLRGQVTPGTGHTIEWVLAAGCVFLAVAALLAWTTVFRSLDRRAGVPGAATSAPAQQIGNPSAPTATPSKSAVTPPPTAGPASGPAAAQARSLSAAVTTSSQSTKPTPPPPATGTASLQPQAAKIPAAETTQPQPGSEAAPEVTPATETPSQPGEPGENELIQALRYLNGAYGRKDTAAAVTWFWQAVAKGNQEAAVRLAGLYLRGEGIEKNCDQARVLLTTAAQKGNAEAAKRLETLPAAGCQ